MPVTANPRLKSLDMETSVLFDTITNRAGSPGATPVEIGTRLQFTFPNAGIQYAAPPGSDFPFLNAGNTDGLETLSVGLQQTVVTGAIPTTAFMAPVATSSAVLNKLYCAQVYSPGVLMEVLNQGTGAILSTFNAGVMVIQAVYGSLAGDKLLIAGGNGLTLLDTATDTLTPVPGTAGFSWYAPVISENGAFMMAMKVGSPSEVFLFDGVGNTLASYLDPVTPFMAQGQGRNHRIAINSLGTLAWLAYTDTGTQTQYLARINAATGIVISVAAQGVILGSPYIELLLDESSQRLILRWDQGLRISLLETAAFAVVNTKTNYPLYRTNNVTSGMTFVPGSGQFAIISDEAYDSAVRIISYLGTGFPSTDSALRTLNVIGSPFTAMNEPIPTQTSPINGFVFSAAAGLDTARIFLGKAPNSPQAVIYAVGIVQNKVRLNTISPLNSGTLYLDGSVALSPLRTLYVDMMAPTGGSSENGAPAVYPFGAIRVDRLAPNFLLGNIKIGEGTLYPGSLAIYPPTTIYGQVTVNSMVDFNAQVDFNSTVDFTSLTQFFSGFQALGPTDFLAPVTVSAGLTVAAGPTSIFNGDVDLNGQTTVYGQFSSPIAAIESMDYQGIGGTVAVVTEGIDLQGGSVFDTVGNVVINPLLDVKSTKRFFTADDFECTTASSVAGGDPADRGLVLKSNNGSRWVVTVSNAGVLRVDPAPQAAPV